MKHFNNKGVSAVIGVILMVAITVAIAATAYVYVSGILYDNEPDVIDGNITDKFVIGARIPYYYFVIENSFDIEVTETVFYNYSIGDYYGNR